MLPTVLWLESLFYAVVVAAVVVDNAREWVSSNPDPVEQARTAYAAGEIDKTEFDRRLEFHLDDWNDQIRVVVEDVTGLGETTSKAIARGFDSLEDLRRADRDRLEGVPGVGSRRPRQYSSGFGSHPVLEVVDFVDHFTYDYVAHLAICAGKTNMPYISIISNRLYQGSYLPSGTIYDCSKNQLGRTPRFIRHGPIPDSRTQCSLAKSRQLWRDSRVLRRIYAAT